VYQSSEVRIGKIGTKIKEEEKTQDPKAKNSRICIKFLSFRNYSPKKV